MRLAVEYVCSMWTGRGFFHYLFRFLVSVRTATLNGVKSTLSRARVCFFEGAISLANVASCCETFQGSTR